MWPWLVKAGNWMIKLLGGWFPIGTKPLGEWLGKVLWVVGLVIAINFVTDYFRPKPSNTSHPTVVALPFSKVENIDQSSRQKSEEVKRRWWQPIPYFLVGGETGYYRSFDGEWDDQSGIKAEAGIRWDL